MKKGEKIGIIVGSTAFLITTIVVISKIRQKRILKSIDDQLSSGKGASGSAKDVAKADALNPNYYKTVSGYVSNPSAAKKVAEAINSDVHYFYQNDQTDIISQITSLGTAAKLSEVAYQFQSEYGKALGDYLVNALSDSNLKLVQSTIASFPNS